MYKPSRLLTFRSRLAAFVFIPIAIVATSCGGSHSSSDNSSDSNSSSKSLVLRVGLQASAGDIALDPAIASTAANANINLQWGDTLIGMSPDGKLVPELATSWAISSDLTTWTIHLRTDVKFSDGSPFTANDVKFSLDRYASPSATSPFASTWATIYKSVSVVDPSTVSIVTKTPQVGLPQLLSDQNSDPIIMSATYLAPAGTDFKAQSALLAKQPVGTGPFTFDSQVTGSSITFVRSTTTWHPKPQVSQLIFNLVSNATGEVNALLSNQVDVISISPDQVQAVKGAGMTITTVKDANSVGVEITGLNRPSAAGKPTQNVLVRQAMSLAIDRTSIIQHLLDGYANIPTTPWDTVPGTPDITVDHFASWSKGLAKYDPAGAKQLLTQAGYPNGVSGIKLYTFPRDEYSGTAQLAQELAAEWKTVGINVTIVQTDYATFRPHIIHPVATDTYNAGDATTWAIGGRFDNQTPLVGYFASNGSAALLPTSPDIDKKIAALQSEPDAAKRQTLTEQVWDEVNAQWVVIPVFNSDQIWATNPKTVKKMTTFLSYPYLGQVLATVQG